MRLRELTDNIYSKLVDVYNAVTSDSGDTLDSHQLTLTEVVSELEKSVPKAANKVLDAVERVIPSQPPFVDYLSRGAKPVSDFLEKGDKYFLRNVNPRVEKHLKRLNRAYKPHLRAIKKAIKKMYIPL
jgi:hypothetical protein